jgi:hypothetical protein
MGGARSKYGEEKDAHNTLVRKPTVTRHVRSSRRRPEYNIKINLTEVGYDDDDDVDWIFLARDTVQWWALFNTALRGGELREAVSDCQLFHGVNYACIIEYSLIIC